MYQSHCILVLFCTSPTRLGQKGTETDGWPPSLCVPVPLYTSPIVYQSHEIGTKGDWDTGMTSSPMYQSHCILVLFCTSPMRLGQKGTEIQRVDPHPYVPVPLYTSPISYQSHETGTQGDWDTEGWPPSRCVPIPLPVRTTGFQF